MRTALGTEAVREDRSGVWSRCMGDKLRTHEMGRLTPAAGLFIKAGDGDSHNFYRTRDPKTQNSVGR